MLNPNSFLCSLHTFLRQIYTGQTCRLNGRLKQYNFIHQHRALALEYALKAHLQTWYYSNLRNSQRKVGAKFNSQNHFILSSRAWEIYQEHLTWNCCNARRHTILIQKPNLVLSSTLC